MSGILTIFSGLPGSGKSTVAQKIVDNSTPGSVVRVNRDDIRTALFGEAYHKNNPDKKCEAQVSQVQEGLIKDSLSKNKHVISDDTNLNVNTIKRLVQIAQNYNAVIKQEHFDIPVDECKRRNKKRGDSGGRFVPPEVIDSMASRAYDDEGHLKEFVIGSNGSVSAVSKYTEGSKRISSFNKEAEKSYPMTSNSVVIVDLDGTLANNSRDLDEAFGVPGQRRDFHKFHKASEHAPVNDNVLRLIKDMRSDDLNIIALSGRTDNYARETINFLKRVGAPVSRLILKRQGDFRPDTDFKLEVLNNLRDEGLAVVHAIDDRPKVVQMWQREGILVSIVPYHEPVDPSYGPTHYDSPEVNTVFGSGYCIRCGQPLKDGGNIGPVCRTKVKL